MAGRASWDDGSLAQKTRFEPVAGEWQPRMPEHLDEEELADWRAGCNAVYQLAALTMPGPRRSVLLGLRHALARILKALHLTGSEPQSRMWRDGNNYSATKDHTRSGPSSSMLSCGPKTR